MQDVEGEGVRLSLSSSVSVSVMLEQPLGLGELRAVDRRILFPFVRAGGEYTLRVSGDRLAARQGRRKAAMLTVPVDWGYGDWESHMSASKTLALPSGFDDLLRCGALCASEDPMLPQLCVIYAELGPDMLSLAEQRSGFGVCP